MPFFYIITYYIINVKPIAELAIPAGKNSFFNIIIYIFCIVKFLAIARVSDRALYAGGLTGKTRYEWKSAGLNEKFAYGTDRGNSGRVARERRAEHHALKC